MTKTKEATLTIGAGLLLAAGSLYFSLTGGTLPDQTPLGCTQNKYEQLPPIQVPEACSTQWVYVCSEFGEWTQQCINGEVDVQLLSDYFNDLVDQLEKASSTYDWTQQGI